MLLWWLRIPIVYLWKMSIDGSCLLMKVVYLWKLSIDGSCLLMKVVYWRKLSIDESNLLMKVIYWWKLSIDERCLLLKVVYWWKLSIDAVQMKGPPMEESEGKGNIFIQAEAKEQVAQLGEGWLGGWAGSGSRGRAYTCKIHIWLKIHLQLHIWLKKLAFGLYL